MVGKRKQEKIENQKSEIYRRKVENKNTRVVKKGVKTQYNVQLLIIQMSTIMIHPVVVEMLF